jgi:hypothetical protein
MSVTSEGLMFSLAPVPATHSPLMKFLCNAMVHSAPVYGGGN